MGTIIIFVKLNCFIFAPLQVQGWGLWNGFVNSMWIVQSFWNVSSGHLRMGKQTLKFFRAPPHARGQKLEEKYWLIKSCWGKVFWNIYHHFWTHSPKSLGLSGKNLWKFLHFSKPKELLTLNLFMCHIKKAFHDW